MEMYIYILHPYGLTLRLYGESLSLSLSISKACLFLFFCSLRLLLLPWLFHLLFFPHKILPTRILDFDVLLSKCDNLALTIVGRFMKSNEPMKMWLLKLSLIPTLKQKTWMWEIILVSRFGQAVKHYAVKQKVLSLIPLELSFPFKSCGYGQCNCDLAPPN